MQQNELFWKQAYKFHNNNTFWKGTSMSSCAKEKGGHFPQFIKKTRNNAWISTQAKFTLATTVHHDYFWCDIRALSIWFLVFKYYNSFLFLLFFLLPLFEQDKLTWDLEVVCCTAFFAPLPLGCWLAKSAKMLSRDHNTKEPRASMDLWFIQSTDVL